MADVLTRLFRRLTWDALPLLDDMLTSEDEGVLAAASATVGDVKYLDKDQWADRLRQLADHPLAIVRRNLVPNLREYIEFDPADTRGLFHELWKDGDEVVRTRLRELMLRMEEVAPDRFAAQVKALHDADIDLEPLWGPLTLRRSERSEAWQAGWPGKENNRRAKALPSRITNGGTGRAFQIRTMPCVPSTSDSFFSSSGSLDAHTYSPFMMANTDRVMSNPPVRAPRHLVKHPNARPPPNSSEHDHANQVVSGEPNDHGRGNPRMPKVCRTTRNSTKTSAKDASRERWRIPRARPKPGRIAPRADAEDEKTHRVFRSITSGWSATLESLCLVRGMSRFGMLSSLQPARNGCFQAVPSRRRNRFRSLTCRCSRTSSEAKAGIERLHVVTSPTKLWTPSGDRSTSRPRATSTPALFHAANRLHKPGSST